MKRYEIVSDEPESESAGYLLALALLVLMAVAKPVLVDSLDPDCFWHLRVADQLVAGHIGPVIDHLSFASVKDPWTPYSWLAELGMRWAWSIDWRCAVAVHAAMSALFVLLVAATCREMQRIYPRSDGNGEFNTILATTAASIWSLAYFSFRPATLAIVLLTFAAWLLVRDRRLKERSRLVWVLVPLCALLTNIHLSALMLPLWVGCLAAGAMWERYRNQSPASQDLERRSWRYVYLACLCAMAFLATPMLPGMVQVIAHYRFADVMVASPIIAEFRPFYDGAFGKISAALALLTIGCVIANWRRYRAGELLWLAVMVPVLLQMGRMAPLFAIIAAPMAAVAWPKLSDRVLRKAPVLASLVIILGLGLWRVGREFPSHRVSLAYWLNRSGPASSSYPIAAADFVADHVPAAHGRIINEFNWGGYLEWRLGPRYQTLMDGRTQLFSSDFWKATYLGDVESHTWVLSKSEADAAILPKRKSLFADDLRALGWQVAWQDDQTQVMLPPAQQASIDPR